jgi:hypothetical protein
MVTYRHAQDFDFDRAQKAIIKIESGETPNVREAASLKRVEEYFTKRAMEQVMTDFPKPRLWEVTRTNVQKAYQIAERLEMPLKPAEPFNVYAALRWIFDSAKGGTLGKPSNDDTASDDALERQRRIRGDLLKLQLEERRGELVASGDVRSLLMTTAELLRKCGDRIAKNFGVEPAEALLDTIDDIVATTAAFFEDIDAKTADLDEIEENLGLEGTEQDSPASLELDGGDEPPQ